MATINDLKIYIETVYMSLGLKPPKKFKKPPIPKLPLNVERSYRKQLQQIVSVINKQIKDILLPSLPGLIASADLMKPRLDSYVDDLQGIMTTIGFNVAQQMPNLETLTRDVGMAASAFNYGQFQGMMKQVFGISPFASEPWLAQQLDAFSAANVQLIKSLPVQELQSVNQIVLSGIGSGRQYGDMAKDITKQFGVTERRANVIARDQVSKLNGQLTGLRQQSVGIEKYIWQTSEDERVRDSHEDQDGNTYSWNDPPSETGNPGNDFSCRCVAIPVIPEL